MVVSQWMACASLMISIKKTIVGIPAAVKMKYFMVVLLV
jgi:hypothetical protein